METRWKSNGTQTNHCCCMCVLLSIWLLQEDQKLLWVVFLYIFIVCEFSCVLYPLVWISASQTTTIFDENNQAQRYVKPPINPYPSMCFMLFGALFRLVLHCEYGDSLLSYLMRLHFMIQGSNQNE